MSFPAVSVRDSAVPECSVRFGDVGQEVRPEPPPEAKLIRIAREAARIQVRAAARAAGVSKSHWAAVEAGYERRDGLYRPMSGTSAATIAHMAHAVGLPPERLEVAGRPDAAEVLSEIIAQEAAAEPEASVDDDLTDTFDMIRDWVEMMNAATPAEREAERARIQSRLNRDKSA